MENTPRQFATELMKLAEEYRNAGNELAKIQIEKSSSILILMAESKSIKEAELKFQASEAGKKELELVYRMRGLKEVISASKVKIRTIESETYNHY